MAAPTAHRTTLLQTGRIGSPRKHLLCCRQQLELVGTMGLLLPLLLPPTYLTAHPPSHLPTHPPIYLSTIYLPTRSSTYLPKYLPTYLLTYIPTHPLIYLPTYLPTLLPTYLPTCLSIWSSNGLFVSGSRQAQAQAQASLWHGSLLNVRAPVSPRHTSMAGNVIFRRWNLLGGCKHFPFVIRFALY